MIAYLPTGSGKTFLAVLLVRHLAGLPGGPLTAGRRIAFLAPRGEERG